MEGIEDDGWMKGRRIAQDRRSGGRLRLEGYKRGKTGEEWRGNGMRGNPYTGT